MRDYELKAAGLPKHVYRQVRAVVQGYEKTKTEYDAILYESLPPPDGQPRGTGVSDDTSRRAMRRARLAEKLEVVEQAILIVPEEYRQGVWDSAVLGIPYPLDADRSTYWRHKAKFYRKVAYGLYLI